MLDLSLSNELTTLSQIPSRIQNTRSRGYLGTLLTSRSVDELTLEHSLGLDSILRGRTDRGSLTYSIIYKQQWVVIYWARYCTFCKKFSGSRKWLLTDSLSELVSLVPWNLFSWSQPTLLKYTDITCCLILCGYTSHFDIDDRFSLLLYQ